MPIPKQSSLTAGKRRQLHYSLWLGCTALIVASFAHPPMQASAQTAAQQLLPSRTQSRSSILSAASPSSVAEQQTATSGDVLTPAPITTASIARQEPEPAFGAIQQVPEGFVQNDNSPALPVDGEEFETRAADSTLSDGIALGSMILRPTLSQSISSQSEKQGSERQHRSYLTTSVRGTLDSDWSRHALRVSGEGRFEHNITGDSLQEQPQSNIEADLRLDLGYNVEAHILGGYRSEKEDVNSPNALGGIQSQGTEHRFNIGGTVAREFGSLRTLAAVDFARTIYDDAKAFDGSAISLNDRDRNEATMRARLGYELSPALIPFLEISGATTRYDNKFDAAGFERSSQTLGAKVGTEINRGEKLSGELSVGYLTRRYDDARLASVDAVSFDALANWSPRRGTDVNFALRTTLDDYADGSESGWANYQFRTGLTHQIRRDLIGRLNAQAEYRDAQDVTEYLTGVGLTYSINRYVDVTADASYKFTPRYDSSDIIVGAGISLKR
jgi:hypothetical protein